MSLRLIMGGSKTGKSSRLYKMLIERSRREKDAKILFIVPEQFTMQTQKRLLLLHPDHALMNIDILSFEGLAHRVMDETGFPVREILDETGKSMVIRKLLSEHGHRLHAFRGDLRRRSFVQQLSLVISELMQYDIGPGQLLEKTALLESGSRLYAKLRDIQLIYSLFMDFISEKYITSEGLLSVLVREIEKTDMLKGSIIFMDNFSDFTPMQYSVLDKILPLSGEINIALDIDCRQDPYERPHRDDLFFITKDTVSKLERLCKARGIERLDDIVLKEITEGLGKEDLLCLEAGIFRQKPAVYEKEPENIELYRADDPDDEMRLAAAKIHEMVRGGELKYSEIAVISPDMGRYLSSARRWFDRYEIPCFYDSRRSVSGNMLIEWLRSLLEMLYRDMSYETVVRHLRSGLGSLKREEIDELENYILAYGIRGRGRWFSPFKRGEKELGEEKLFRINELRERFTAPLSELGKYCGKKNIRVGEFIPLIYRYMEDCEIDAAIEQRIEGFDSVKDAERIKEYEQICDVVTDILERIYLLLEDEEMSIRDYSQVLESGIAQLKLGIIPPGIDQVTFGDIRRSRLGDVKVLIFAGLNEGLLPAMESPAGLITDMEREILGEIDLYLAPTAVDNLRSERFYLYSRMTMAADRLILSYSGRDSAGGELFPSRILADIREIFPGLKVRPSRGDLPMDLRSGYDYIVSGFSRLSEGAWSVSGAGLSDEEKESFKKIYRWFLFREDKAERMRRLSEAAAFRYQGDSLSKAAVDALYGGELRGGVSMLEKYASCAYAHFLSYGLRLAKREVYEVQAPDIGLIFHKAIELFSKRVTGSGLKWRDIDAGIRDSWVEEAVLSTAASYRGEMMQDSGRAVYLTECITRMAKRSVWALQQQIIKGDFEPEDYEMYFSSAISSERGTILSEGDRTLYLNGVIDRIDCCRDSGELYIRIIDYKSGKTKFDLSSVYHGLQLQLMVYMNAARKKAESSNDFRVIPAGVFYYDIDDPMIETESFGDFMRKLDDGDHDYTEDEIKILESLSLNGLVLEEDEAIRHHDNHPEERPKIIPVKYTKSGDIDRNSSTADGEKFFLLSRFVEEKCFGIAEDIFSGNIGAKPYVMGKRSACDYCDYLPVCGFSTSIRGYRPRRLSRLSRDDAWEAMAGSLGGGNGD